jgi:hypothetical protein
MALILVAFFVPAIVGAYIYQRQSDGILAAQKLSKHPRLSAALRRTDDYTGALAGAPVAFSILGGVCVFAYRLFFIG